MLPSIPCSVCGLGLTGQRIVAGGDAAHPECVGSRLPQDALVALFAAAVTVAVPVLLVTWGA